MKKILVDIDHTLSDAFWRDEMMKGGPNNTNWDDYHSASKDDKTLPVFVDLINALNLYGYDIVLITARPEKWRKLTMDWLCKHDINVEELLMRADDCFRSSPELKIQLVEERFGNKDHLHEQIAFVMDDREDVIQAFTALGIPALQVFGRRK